jgi:uncharacterized protein YciI
MDALVNDGLLILGGPLEGDREVLEIFAMSSEGELTAKLAEDPWTPNGMLTTKSVERWTVLLDGRD